ncbi:MAG: hypothetical protein AAB425_11355 [Bdellovibrionota bacterium]
MKADKELLEAFEQEVREISELLTPTAERLRIHYMSHPALFEEFGLIIDRIYGTAATFELMEIANYCRAIKQVTYQCAQSDNTYARSQVKDLALSAVPIVKRMAEVIHDPVQLKSIRYQMQKEQKRAEELSNRIFGSTRKGPAAA